MATIVEKKNKLGELVSYKLMCCVGRDEAYKQVWRTKTIKRPEGLTPARERKEVQRQADAWEQEQKAAYKQGRSPQDKDRVTFADFVRLHWWKDHVMDGEHTPDTISFYQNMSADLLEYFGDHILLGQISTETVKRYIGFMRKDARKKDYALDDVADVTMQEDGSGRVVLTWGRRKNALSYQVYRQSGRQRTPRKIAEVSEPTYTDAEAGGLCIISYSVKMKKQVSGEPYSSATIQHHYKTLVNILGYARRMGYLGADPCANLSIKDKPHVEDKEIDFLDSSQAREFLRCLEAEPLYWRALENVLIVTGLRRGEVVGLQWGDISKDGLTLYVKRNITVDKNSDTKFHIGKTKGKDARPVPISRRVYKLLTDLNEEQEQKYGTLLPSAYIFCRDGDPYTPCYPTEPTRWQRKFVKRHGLEDVSPHDLRHTAATLALEGGADLKQVQDLLGHKDPTTTMKFYAGVSKEQQRQTVDGIESLIS